MSNAILLGTTTLLRMVNITYGSMSPLYRRIVQCNCVQAKLRIGENPSVGDEKVYVYYHLKLNRTVMTTIEGGIFGQDGSFVEFMGKVELQDVPDVNTCDKCGARLNAMTSKSTE